jgi:hypothetical protein
LFEESVRRFLEVVRGGLSASDMFRRRRPPAPAEIFTGLFSTRTGAYGDRTGFATR